MTNKLKEIQHLTRQQIASLVQKLQPFCWTGGFCTLVGLHYLVCFALQGQSKDLKKVKHSRVKSNNWDWNWDFWKVCLDIKIGIENFEIWVLISRSELRILKFESWYRDWNWESQIVGSLWSADMCIYRGFTFFNRELE